MSFDNVCKYLAELYPVAFANWLLPEAGDEPVRVLKTELSLEPIRADSLTFLRTSNQILHLEFQTSAISEPSIPFRMLDYAVRLKRQYRLPVRQIVIFLQPTNNSVVFTEEYRDETSSHRYRVIRMWEQNPEPFLVNTALLPLATLTQTDSPTRLLTRVAEQAARIEVREQRQNILGCAGILAGLRFEESLISQIFREEVMKESVTYQAILREGRQQGIQQGIEQGIQQGRERELALVMRLLNRRIGVVSPEVRQRIENLSIARLEDLGEALLDFTTQSDLVSWLDQR